MRTKCLLLLLIFALAAPASAQKGWANRAEYDLYLRAVKEVAALRQIELLREWEATYPNSEFQQERTTMFVMAYKKAGQVVDAFERATQLVKLDPSDISASYMIAVLAPSLQTPSTDQIRITVEAANNLLSRAPEMGRLATPATRPASKIDSPQANDPETQRVGALIRELRRGKHIPTAAGLESEARRVAKRALAWAKDRSK